MQIPKDILHVIATFLGNPEKERRQLNKILLCLVTRARDMYIMSERKRKPKWVAEGINYAVLRVLSEQHTKDSDEMFIFDHAIRNALRMGL